MMTLAQTKTAVGINITASFLASGGTGLYTYSVLPKGAGGSIDSSTGVYTAPSMVPDDPSLVYDTIQVQDSSGAIATSKILVGTPLLLFCEILQQELGLADGRVFIFDQKVFQPTDSGLYIAISVPTCKPFSNNTKPGLVNGVPDWSQSTQETNFLATLDINAMSRDNSALNRKEEILLALNSIYAQTQQEGNSFYIGKLPPNAAFKNLSMIDGAAIPYRYNISVNIQYAVTKTKSVPYFDSFSKAELTLNP